MGETKFQRNLFTLMMCVCMVAGMSIYNVWLREGFTAHIFVTVAREFFLVFVIAFALDFFIVGPLVKKVIFMKFNPHDHPLSFSLSVAISMTITMVFLMSVFGVFMQAGFTVQAVSTYPHTVMLNFIAALPLNLLIVSPLVRFAFLKIFHVTIEADDAYLIEEELHLPHEKK